MQQGANTHPGEDASPLQFIQFIIIFPHNTLQVALRIFPGRSPQQLQ